jgi:hypothetical protein
MVTDPTLWSTKAHLQCTRWPGKRCASYENNRRFLGRQGKNFTIAPFLHRRHTWSHAPGVSYKLSVELPGLNGDRSDVVKSRTAFLVLSVARMLLEEKLGKYNFFFFFFFCICLFKTLTHPYGSLIDLPSLTKNACTIPSLIVAMFLSLPLDLGC